MTTSSLPPYHQQVAGLILGLCVSRRAACGRSGGRDHIAALIICSRVLPPRRAANWRRHTGLQPLGLGMKGSWGEAARWMGGGGKCGDVLSRVVQCGVVWRSVWQCAVDWSSGMWNSVLQCSVVWSSGVYCGAVLCSVV